MTGLKATFDDSTMCSIKRALNLSFVYPFIQENAVNMMNLIYVALACKISHGSLPKIVVKSAATSNSTYTTKITPK